MLCGKQILIVIETELKELHRSSQNPCLNLKGLLLTHQKLKDCVKLKVFRFAEHLLGSGLKRSRSDRLRAISLWQCIFRLTKLFRTINRLVDS